MTSAAPPRQPGSAESTAVRQRRKLRTARPESFSDGVFAIAVTLLVLDIAVPASAKTGGQLLRLVARLWPSYLVLIVTWLFVPVVAVGGYLAIALYFIIPFRHRFTVSFKHRRARQES